MLNIDPKAARNAWSYAAVFLVLWGFLIVRKTVLLFVLSVMFAYLLFPIVEMTQKRLRVQSRMLSLILVFGTSILSLCAAGFLLRGPVNEERRNLELQIDSPEFKRSLANWHVLGFPAGEVLVDGHGLNHIQAQVKSQFMEIMPQLGRGLTRAARDIGNLFIIPILAFFMLLDARRIREFTLELWFHSPSRGSAAEVRRIVECVLEDAHTMILQYVRALVLLCFAVLLAYSVVLEVMGVKYALLLALFAFPLEFIPLIGPLIAGMLIIAVCEFNQYSHLAWVIAFLIGFRLFQDYVLSPHLMKSSVKLHPLLIIFGVFAGGEIGGVGGIFLSVPVLALARLIFYEYRKYALGRTAMLASCSHAEPINEAVAYAEPAR